MPRPVTLFTGQWAEEARPRSAAVWLVLAAIVGLLLAGVPGSAEASEASGESGRRWVASWATAQHTTKGSLENQTVRTIVHLTQGGDLVRVRIGNTLGTEPMEIGAVMVGLRDSGARLVKGTVRAATFDGSRSVVVPPGEYVVSDPVRFATTQQQDLVVSMHVPGNVVPSAHDAAFDTNYLTAAGAGDHTGDLDDGAFTTTTTSHLMLMAVDVSTTSARGTVVVTGGSVTDGAGSRTTGYMGTGPAAPPNSRWSDVLARRIVAELPGNAQFAVANAGIGGNTASRECAIASGPYSNVEDRFARDVLGLSGVSHVFVYAGTNDLGFGCGADQIIAAFTRLVERAHARGVKVVFATITPRLTYTALQNEERFEVNSWILRGGNCGGVCDGVMNFDAVVSWSANPNAIDPRYDAGDMIHPNADGYRRMGQVIDLGFLAGESSPGR
ncbi:GDSL-type esterase/lipase family protein [Streptomyces himalayensis]|uniref:SGNH hydrolase n=1 Tax=Streptomyces himalayensis subsp. himalayensis TaxID=2756131 RepID=A0A7W0I7W8_9ACTN|nr:GDSL-type esterase/lipase family protein [Streptomyces himalayensis]MBA2945647.1 SGNH hydrolase [Streptomyces himalayensis subsp. himalayensis]